ncbi:MAG: protein kinase [Gemmatimonadaceae bacterium]|nr:protein kinase [Gemmatimonadaceae bacterium]
MADLEQLEQLKAALAGRYSVERELGHGGMATVYLATDVRHERQVAIKVLHPDLSATIGGERFEREIKLAARLQHPHILGLIDSGDAGGLLYYVMPFIEGESVRDKLDREKQLSVDEAIQITLEVADALGYAHAQGIVHRDIKPENVMLANGHALVADFGIARARSEAGQQKLTQTGMAVGTPVYMSPEQSTGENVGPAADIYSLGCMLYEMLAGEPPFTGPNSMAIMAKHAMEAVPSIRIVRPSVPEEVEEAIFAAMEKAVADRPRTLAEFCEIMGTPLGATATRRAMTRHTAQRRVPTGASRVYPAAEAPAWWKKPWAIGGGVAALAAAGWIGVQLLSGDGAGSVAADPLARKIAVRYFTVSGGDVDELRPAADRLTESLIRELSTARTLTVISPNGVAPFREADVARDSVARALGVGMLVEGTVEPDGAQRVTITTRLYDGDGGNLGRARTVSVLRDSLFSAEGEVAREVSIALRDVLGAEIQLRESQAGTRSMAAWSLLSRAERARREAAAFGPANPDSALSRLALADSLIRDARAADDRWIEPALQAVQVAYDRRRYVPPAAVGAVLDSAMARVEAALAVDASSAKALEWRGTIKYAQWANGRLTMDPVVREALLNSAEEDLLAAIQRDDGLITAYATLSFVYYDKKDVPASLTQARTAYQRDEFLSNSAAILNRLFFGSYDTQLFAEARKWCAEGGRRFPRNPAFTVCRLWLLLAPDETPDVALAWQLAARLDSLVPPAQRPFQSHLARVLVGGVIGRQARTLAAGPQQAGMLDSARRVIQEGMGNREVDPRQELPGYAAVMHAQFGDLDRAISLMTAYVAANPDHSFRVGGNLHWWYRDLQNEPGFRRLLDRTR